MARAVCRSQEFQAELEARFGRDRGPNGEPSVSDIERDVLDSVEWALGERFEDYPLDPKYEVTVLRTHPGIHGPMVFYARLACLDGEEVVELLWFEWDDSFDWGLEDDEDWE